MLQCKSVTQHLSNVGFQSLNLSFNIVKKRLVSGSGAGTLELVTKGALEH